MDSASASETKVNQNNHDSGKNAKEKTHQTPKAAGTQVSP
jgi:hypothetical protein